MDSDFILDYEGGTDSGIINGPFGVWNDYTLGSSVTLEDVYFNNGITELLLDDVYIVESVTQEDKDLNRRTVTYSSGLDEGSILGNFSAFVAGRYLTLNRGSARRGA